MNQEDRRSQGQSGFQRRSSGGESIGTGSACGGDSKSQGQDIGSGPGGHAPQAIRQLINHRDHKERKESRLHTFLDPPDG